MKLGPSVALLAGLMLLVAACAAPQLDARPTAAPSTSNRFGAPNVPRRLDITSIASTPCRTLFSPSELTAMRATQPSASEFLGIKRCAWSVRTVSRLSVDVYANRDLLADTYRAHLDPVFVPTSIEGFPAVRQKTGRGELNICTVTTGVGERAALDVVWVAPGDPRPGNDACEFAEQATALVIRKLPPQR